MSTRDEELTAEHVLHRYAEALNKANMASISSFYAFDGLFMPDGFKTLAKKDLDEAGGKFLANRNFSINYDIQNVTVGHEFTLVDAIARTTNIWQGGEEKHENSRDFFVLKKDGTDWKIYRYLFNKIKD